MEDHFILSATQVARIAKLLKEYDSGHLTQIGQLRAGQLGGPLEINLGVAAETIAAGDSGIITRYRFENDDFTEVTDDDEPLTAYDWLNTGITEDEPCVLVRLAGEDGVRWVFIKQQSTAGQVHYAKATTNWSHGAFYPSHASWNVTSSAKPWVTCVDVDDELGTNPQVDTFIVNLHPNAKGDPNVVEGDIIIYTYAPNGSRVCVSDYMDDPIGTVKLWTGTIDDIRPGWKCMNGSQTNTRTGSAYSTDCRFVAGTCSDGACSEDGGPSGGVGTTGGSATHDHGGATGDASTGIIVYDPNSGVGPEDTRHIKHNHRVTVAFTDGEDTYQSGESHHLATGNVDFCTTSERDGNSEESSCGTPVDLDHAVYDPEHNHSITAANHIPPFLKLRYIERIDNSV